MASEDVIKKALREIGTYKNTVSALIAVGNEICWDMKKRVLKPGAEFSFGRRMKLKSTNSPGNPRTPDLIAQVDVDYGVLGEARVSSTLGLDLYDKLVADVKKYDAEFSPWFTPPREGFIHDLIVIIHLNKKQSFVRRLKELRENGEISFDRNLVVLSFNIGQETDKQFIQLGIEDGSFSDRGLASRLEYDILPIDFATLVATHGNILFYDADPPAPYLAYIIWEKVLPRYISVKNIAMVDGVYRIPVTTKEIVWDLRRFYSKKHVDLHDRTMPRVGCVRDILDKYVEIDHAETPIKGRYIVKYKYPRADLGVLEYFIRKLAKSDKKRLKTAKPTKGQQELLGHNDDST